MAITCSWSRALSLQAVASESTYSAHLALERHCCVYGTPKSINCDNGTNWVGLAADMKEQWSYVQSMVGQTEWENEPPKIIFNPPHSPRFGGHFETMVKICRKSMEKVLPVHGLVEDEEFNTLLAQVQKFANDRPLNRASPDFKDPVPLTPADLLGMGQPFKELMPLTEHDDVVSHKRHMRKVYKELWTAFTEEFLAELQVFRKRKNNPHEYKTGDFVFLISETQRKPTAQRTMVGPVFRTYGRYRMGVIRQIRINTEDEHGRVFLVETKPNHIVRLSYMQVAPVLI